MRRRSGARIMDMGAMEAEEGVAQAEDKRLETVRARRLCGIISAVRTPLFRRTTNRTMKNPSSQSSRHHRTMPATLSTTLHPISPTNPTIFTMYTIFSNYTTHRDPQEPPASLSHYPIEDIHLSTIPRMAARIRW
mmetsp:Transcript_4278/g.10516  ORF Transcript_4278/g.10516 Transcript_4278/m.10516 type:complete len:135 (+) Transcript_4278:330-734(+)